MAHEINTNIKELYPELYKQLHDAYQIPLVSVRIPLRLVVYFAKNKKYTYLKTFVALKTLCDSSGYIDIDMQRLSITLDSSVQTIKRHLNKLLEWQFIGKAHRSPTGFFIRAWTRCERELSKTFDLSATDLGFSEKSIEALKKGTKKIADRHRYFIYKSTDFFTQDIKALLLYSRLDTQLTRQEYMHFKNNPALRKARNKVKRMSTLYEANEHAIADYTKAGKVIPENLLKTQRELKPFHTKHENTPAFPAVMGESGLSKIYSVSRASANRYRNRMRQNGFIVVLDNNEYIHGSPEQLQFKHKMLSYSGVRCFVTSNTLVIPKANQILKTNMIDIKYKSRR